MLSPSSILPHETESSFANDFTGVVLPSTEGNAKMSLVPLAYMVLCNVSNFNAKSLTIKNFPDKAKGK